jgi:GNAT superfamily N-acetyltransferase
VAERAADSAPGRGRPGSSPEPTRPPAGIALRRILNPADTALRELSELLHATFLDPDTVLELDRMQAFLAERAPPSPAAARLPSVDIGQPQAHELAAHEVAEGWRTAPIREEHASGAVELQASTPGTQARQFCVVVAENEDGVVLGGTVFSYVVASNCGFSEYLVAWKERRSQGLGRKLFEARRVVLDELARAHRQPRCLGLFIEADNPERTPAELQTRERETAMDARTRQRLFTHLGFLRVDIAYTQPPLGPGKQPVAYLDLLFAPWDEFVRQEHSVPADWVAETLCPIWETWAPGQASRACQELRQRLGQSAVALIPL